GGIGDREAMTRAGPTQRPEPAGSVRVRARAEKAGAAGGQRAGAEIALALQNRVLLVVAQEKSGIALAVGEVATHDHGVVLGLAVRADIARHMELRGVRCLARRNNILDGAVLLVEIGRA